MQPTSDEVTPPGSLAPAASANSNAQPPIVRSPMWLGNSDLIAAVWLVGSLVCLSLAALMSVGNDRRVSLAGWDQPLPEICWTYKNLKIDCPGCGLTRTFIHMAHGRPLAALGTNPVGVLVFLFVCLQVPMGIAQLIFRRRGPWVEFWGYVNDWGVAGLLIALLVQWGIKLII